MRNQSSSKANLLLHTSLIFCGLAAIWTTVGCNAPINSPTRQTATEKKRTKIKTVNVIRLAKVKTSTETAIYFGKLEPNRQSRLGFGRNGTVKSIAAVGQRIKSGELVAQLDQSDLEKQKTETESSMRTLRQRPQGASQQRLDQLEGRQRDIEDALARGTIKASFDCVVSDVYISEGGAVTPQSPALRVVEDAQPMVKINLPRRIADRIPIGQSIWALIGKQTVTCTVDYKSLDEHPVGSKAINLKIGTDLKDNPWAFGQTVEVRFDLKNENSGCWLPLTGLNRDSTGLWAISVVFPTNKKNTEAKTREFVVSRKIVEIVQIKNNWALIQGSLSDGELVIVNGAHRVVAGQRVRVRDVTDNPSFASPVGAAE